MTTEREAFEAWVNRDGDYLNDSNDAARVSRAIAWLAWQAACAWQREQVSVPDQMTEVADRFAHRMALVMECVLMGNSSDRWWNEGWQLLGEYRSAMNAIHERESPTFMGEPVIRECADKIRSDAMTYQPKGSLCFHCIHKARDCSHLPFHEMCVVEQVWNVRIVRCTDVAYTHLTLPTIYSV